MKIDETLNRELNTMMREEFASPGLWDHDEEWELWAETKGGDSWYTVLDKEGIPTQENIIEDAAGNMFYLCIDEAVAKWEDITGFVGFGDIWLQPAISKN